MQQNNKPNKQNASRFSFRSFFRLSQNTNSLNTKKKTKNNRRITKCENTSSSLTISSIQKVKNEPEISEFGDIGCSKNASKTSVFTIKKMNHKDTDKQIVCNICYDVVERNQIYKLMNCTHSICYKCLETYLQIEISESRVFLNCPMCYESIHPNEIRIILKNETLLLKYEDFMIRKVLALEPDARWCPAPDCGYAVIATGCAGCPKLKCERPGCNSYFCYHCKSDWHPNQTCDAARNQRMSSLNTSSISPECIQNADFKQCPMCQVLIVKMDDGSCNHMVCALCGAEFCWLCMKVVGDLHYLSPSGCTFWGKKPWSKKKKILWQLGTLIGAPVGIILVAGIAVPALIIGIPVWVARKIYYRYQTSNKRKRNIAIFAGALASALISPILAGLAVSVGVPILLFYVYGIVPISLCRNGECDKKKFSKAKKDIEKDEDIKTVYGDTNIETVINPSIGEESIISGSHILRLEVDNDRGSISNKALAGSIISNAFINLPTIPHIDDQGDLFKINISVENLNDTQEALKENFSSVLKFPVHMEEEGATSKEIPDDVKNLKMVSDQMTNRNRNDNDSIDAEDEVHHSYTDNLNESKSKKSHSTFRNLRKFIFHSRSKTKRDDCKKDKLSLSNDNVI